MSEQTVGVRLRGESRLIYAIAADDIRAGDWVVVSGSGNERQGCVVITEDQLVLAETEPALARVLRKVSDADLLVDTDVLLPARSIAPEEQIGFGGPGRPPTERIPNRGTSIEDDNYRTLKSRFPRLGDLVLTDGGEVMVVGVTLRTSTLMVRSAGEVETRTIDVQDVLAGMD